MDENFDPMRSAWNDFIEHGTISPDVRKEVAESWKFCRSIGVDPMGGVGFVLDSETLGKRLKSNNRLISIAHPIMEQIYRQVEGSGFVIVLVDKDGYLIDRIGDGHVMGEARKLNFVEGALWTEEAVGTNAIGLALRLNIPIQLTGAEHYCITHQISTCAAAPIHDEKGDIIGCLDMTGMREEAHTHTLGIVLAGAYSIEKQVALIKSHQIIDAAIDSINEGMIITDQSLHIIRANNAALNILGASVEELIGDSVKTIVQNPEVINEAISKTNSVYDFECTFVIKDRQVRSTANFIPISTGKISDGVVITFREEKYIHGFVNKIVGYRASYIFDNIITDHPYMKKIIDSARKAARADCNVLLMGESGTGKELFAQSIHNDSRRAKGPFVAVNCASIPKDLVESELFGYEKGAFTGANKEGHPGKFELANGGTIFLDEIGELPLEVQPKMLRVLDDHKISRVGGTYEKILDVRVISATNRNLRDEVDRKNFREDLYYRLNVISITIPPLRDRVGDITLLANIFLEKLNRINPIEAKTMSASFMDAIEKYNWPGNVRELQNVIERAFYLTEGSIITEECLPDNMRISADPKRLGENVVPMEVIEEASIRNALTASDGNILKAAYMLNLSRATMYRKIKRYGIKKDEIKKEREFLNN